MQYTHFCVDNLEECALCILSDLQKRQAKHRTTLFIRLMELVVILNLFGNFLVVKFQLDLIYFLIYTKKFRCASFLQVLYSTSDSLTEDVVSTIKSSTSISSTFRSSSAMEFFNTSINWNLINWNHYIYLVQVKDHLDPTKEEGICHPLFHFQFLVLILICPHFDKAEPFVLRW